MDIKNVKQDITAQETGRWFDVDSETSFKIAAAGNKSYHRKLKQVAATRGVPNIRKELEKIDQLFDNDRIEKIREIIGTAAVGTVLLGWKGLKENGADLPYTEENALKIMVNPAYDEVYKVVFDFANEVQNFKAGVVEAAKKSQETSSDTEAEEGVL